MIINEIIYVFKSCIYYGQLVHCQEHIILIVLFTVWTSCPKYIEYFEN